MRAAYRQAGYERAVFLAAVLESGLRRVGSKDAVSRVQCPGEFAAEEARAALVWSRRRADTSFGLAWDVHRRLPMLGEAMYAGDLDEDRARAFTQWTSGLTDAQAGQIIAVLLPQAAGLLVGELIDRIKRMAIAIDPDWAERRYRTAVKGRRVQGSRNDDGTANLAGLDLPVDRVAAACDRVDALARACKRAGDRRRIDHVRVDVYLGMLDATFEGMSDEQIIAHVLAHPFTDPTEAPTTSSHNDHPGDDNPGGHGGPGQHDGPGGGPSDHGGLGDGGGSSDDPSDGGPGGPGDGNRPGSPEGDGSAPGDSGSDRPGGAPAGSHGPNDDDDPGEHGEHDGPSDGDSSGEHDGPGGSGSDDGSGNNSPSEHDRLGDGDGPGSGGGPGDGGRESAGVHSQGNDGARERGHDGADGCAVGWSVRELRVELLTLLGLNEHPAEIAGWDFVPASLARRLVPAMVAGEWRWVVCGADGRMLDCGITDRRPTPTLTSTSMASWSDVSHVDREPGSGQRRGREQERGRERQQGGGPQGQRRDRHRDWRRERRRAGIVELQVKIADLDRLVHRLGSHGRWDAVIADIAHQHGLTVPGTNVSAPGTSGSGTGVPGTPASTPGTSVPGTSGSGTGVSGMGGVGEDAERRSAGARLRRAIQIRDRRCTHPACRARAIHTDQDHAIDHADGGLTTAANLSCCCRHDHRLKHDGGWLVDKPHPEITVWTSPLGHTYVNTTTPVIPPLPQPQPLADVLDTTVITSHTHPGQAGHGHTPPGQAGHGHTPPGQAGHGHTPPGQAGHGHTPPGQAGHGHTPPGQAGPGQAGRADTAQRQTEQEQSGPGPGKRGPELDTAEAYAREGEKWHPHTTPLPVSRVKQSARVLACGCHTHCRCHPILPPAPAHRPAQRAGTQTTTSRSKAERYAHPTTSDYDPNTEPVPY
nr:HNH endonuclease signature motif containing protein [Phytoactinopolyspora alkaliphila]